jgi:single-strand DNA-binding protein
MSTTITGKLNKPASQFQAGESTGFGLRLGVKFYDRETKADQWTNYEAVVFAKAPTQIQFYQSALVENAIVEVSGDKLKIRQFQGNNGLSLSIELLDAKLGAVFAPQGQAPQQQRQPQQAQQQPQQQGFYNPPQGQAPRPAPAQYNQAPQQPYNQQQFDPNMPDF